MPTDFGAFSFAFKDETGQRMAANHFLGWLLLSMALHGLLLFWVTAPVHQLPAPALLINATLRLIAPPETPAVHVAETQESRVAEAPLISHRLESQRLEPSAKKARPARITPPVPRAVRQPASPSEPQRDETPQEMASASATSPVSPELAKPAPAPTQVATKAPAQVDQQQMLGRYAQQLSLLLSSQQVYPRLAAMRGWEGEVRLRLKVARKGNLLSLQVDRSSGYEILDQHALQLVELVRMPPFPEALEGSEIQITVPVNYKLDKAV